ncbi:MAG: hypothetical protein V4539_03940 [Bacteroidota bacterium]
MKKKHFFGFAVCVSFLYLVSCQPVDIVTPICTAGVNNDTAVFVYQQPTSLFGSCVNGLQGTVTDLNDSRCPLNAVCFTAGNIFATLQIDNQFSIKLISRIPVDTTYQGQKYSFTLVNATPYPDFSVNQTQIERKAFIRIVKR